MQRAAGKLLRSASAGASRSLRVPQTRAASSFLQLYDIPYVSAEARFRQLPGVEDQVFLTYIWIDGTGEWTRAKTKVVDKEPTSIDELDGWFFDGSSTGQAVGHNSDMFLKPVAMRPDPFYPTKSKLVLCEVYSPADGKPHATNHRAALVETVKKVQDQEPMFGFEQEYTLMGKDARPLGFPPLGFPDPQGKYYCSVGIGRSYGRNVCDSHLLACRYAGLSIGGINAEVLLGQWEYQVGPGGPLDVADDTWFSRYLLYRVSENFGANVSLDVKPVEGDDWNGSGGHMNFSTKAMRGKGGIDHIWAAIKKLEPVHAEHVKVYDPNDGEDNKRRLTGSCEAPDYHEFSAAAASRNVSVRIPRAVEQRGYGWLEDRRPASNADPYQVVHALLKTCCLN